MDKRIELLIKRVCGNFGDDLMLLTEQFCERMLNFVKPEYRKEEWERKRLPGAVMYNNQHYCVMVCQAADAPRVEALLKELSKDCPMTMEFERDRNSRGEFN